MRQLKICDKNYGDGTYGKIKEREREREKVLSKMVKPIIARRNVSRKSSE